MQRLSLLTHPFLSFFPSQFFSLSSIPIHFHSLYHSSYDDDKNEKERSRKMKEKRNTSIQVSDHKIKRGLKRNGLKEGTKYDQNRGDTKREKDGKKFLLSISAIAFSLFFSIFLSPFYFFLSRYFYHRETISMGLNGEVALNFISQITLSVSDIASSLTASVSLQTSDSTSLPTSSIFVCFSLSLLTSFHSFR